MWNSDDEVGAVVVGCWSPFIVELMIVYCMFLNVRAVRPRFQFVRVEVIFASL
jgi:hypothetical protein